MIDPRHICAVIPTYNNGGTVVDNVQRGDVNNDGKITIDDATKLQRYIARIDSAAGDETFTARADVNGDGNVNIVDVTEIQRYLAGCGNPHKIGEAV